ncbi:MAG: hypothetical protein ISS74_02540 [Planctomycetes bacterium]|nr:hypothetical protein [Planctomycetota bacterium]
MKSQRRHELQTNELADALGRLIERARPHSNAIAIGAGLVIIAIIVLIAIPLMRGRAEAAAESAFALAIQAPGPEPLEHFLEQYPGAVPSPAARLALADRLLASVAAGMVDTADPAKAQTALAEAEGLYTDVAAASSHLVPLARTGLALVALERGDLDQGRSLLKEVTETWPESVAAARAKVHLGMLADYKPVTFSDEPLEAPTPPAVEKPAAPAVEEPETPAVTPAPGEGATPPSEGEPAPTPDAPAPPAGDASVPKG